MNLPALGLPGSLENPRGVRPLAPRSAKMRSLSSFEYIRTSLIEVQESAALPLRIWKHFFNNMPFARRNAKANREQGAGDKAGTHEKGRQHLLPALKNDHLFSTRAS
mgnify:CR=1 FL=1